MLIDKSERVRDMRFQSAIATQIWLDCFDTPSDIIGLMTAPVLFNYR